MIKSNKQHIVMLPFSMGEFKGLHPGTYVEVIEHPFLSIGSSYSILKPDIHLWLDNAIGSDSWDFGFSSSEGEYYICFDNEAHKNWFLLRWSCN